MLIFEFVPRIVPFLIFQNLNFFLEEDLNNLNNFKIKIKYSSLLMKFPITSFSLKIGSIIKSIINWSFEFSIKVEFEFEISFFEFKFFEEFQKMKIKCQ